MSTGFRDTSRSTPRPIALQMRHIQFNTPHTYQWMIFDIDRRNALYAFEEADLPPPNVIMVNPKNGHAHAAYFMATPIARHAAARDAPIRFFAAVERGIARRVGADMSYAGLLAKNPLHPDWYVVWQRDAPYELHELNDYLSKDDKRPEGSIERTSGTSRNVFVFDELRRTAYSKVRQFKKEGASFDAWYGDCLTRATKLNSGFANPMRHSEVKGIAKSVAKWTWKKFSLAEFSARQSRCGSRPCGNRVPDSIAMPWKNLGISRATYYRRKKAAKASRAVEAHPGLAQSVASLSTQGEVDLFANGAASASLRGVGGLEPCRHPQGATCRAAAPTAKLEAPAALSASFPVDEIRSGDGRSALV